MKPRVLLIDDEDLVVRSVTKLLAKGGYDVFTCLNGDAAIERAGQDRFDFVVCDVRMPGKDGVETAHQIRILQAAKGNALIPIVFLTGYADPLLEKKARELNPVDYMMKPFDALQLLDLIRISIEGRTKEVDDGK